MVLLSITIIVLICLSHELKTPIENATYGQLVAVEHIGTDLAKDILEYVEPGMDIDDIQFDPVTREGIKYIGEKRIQSLRKHFR